MGKSFNKEGVRVAFVLVHFSIFYRFGDKTIEVLLFWDNRQDPEKLRELISKA